MELQKAQQLAIELMRKHGLLSSGWRFQWSGGKRQLGEARIQYLRDPRSGNKTPQRKLIKLSRHLVSLNDEAEVRDTILHEIAHAIAGLHHGHDEHWKAICRRIGARPERLAGERVAVVEPRYLIVCGMCGKTLAKRHRRPGSDRLARGYCKWCGPGSSGTLGLRDNLVQDNLEQ